MIKKIICFSILVIFLYTNIALAKSKIVDFSLGCATSFLIHEAAHWIVGNSTGKLSFEPDENGWPVGIYRGDNEGLFKTASAGFIVDLTLQEYYLQKRPEDDIWKGIFWYSTLGNLLYSLQGGGDFESMSQSSGISEGVFRSIVAAITILDIYRYYHEEKRTWLLIAPKAISLGFVITF